MRDGPRRRGRLRVAFLIVGVSLALLLVPSAGATFRPAAGGGGGPTPPPRALPPDTPARGLVYRGLERSADPSDPCRGSGLLRVSKVGSCTHGPDAAPPGVDVTKSVAPVAIRTPSPTFQCSGDGVAGLRTQVLYVHASDVPDRYDTYLQSFRQWAGEADAIYALSAAETGGDRHVRFVHDAACQPTVPDITVSPTGDDDFGSTISELQALGYNRSDRKYMAFVDATVYCGIGNVLGDDQPGPANANNGGPSYGRSDSWCWNGATAAHEHTHNLGGVQLSAPNSSGGWHCVDEYDVMCYSDFPSYPPMQYLCPDSSRNTTRFDCNHDDYYNTDPPAASYLASHWNVANSLFLTTAQLGSISGTVRRSDGTPIVGVRVGIDGVPAFASVTGADGSYAIGDVPNGSYTVRAGLCIADPEAVTVNGATTVDFIARGSSDVAYTCEPSSPSWVTANTVLVLTGDDASQAVTLPFSFKYYGQTYDTVHVSTNGFVNFLEPRTDYPNTPVPDPAPPNAAIYPFWDDLVVDSSASVRTQAVGTAPNRQLVIEWQNVRPYTDANQRLSFEIVLHEDGRIGFAYQEIESGGLEQGGSATIGIENELGTSAIQASNNNALVATDQAITFTPTLPNDAFASALPLQGTNGTLNDTNSGATKEPGEPNHAGNPGGASRWYTFTAPGNGTLTVDTFGSGFDTLLAAYTGTNVAALTPVVANDDDSSLQSYIGSFPVTAGLTYSIAVDGYSGSTGPILLHWSYGATAPTLAPLPQVLTP